MVGISKDTVSSHRRFRDKLGLPFPILADPGREVLGLYGVLREKTMYGKKVQGTDRSTFLIDREGIIRTVWRGVRVDGHAAEVLGALREMTGAGP